MRHGYFLCGLACLLSACVAAPKYNYEAKPLTAGTTAPVTDSQSQPKCHSGDSHGGIVCAAYIGVLALEQALAK